MDAIQYMEKPEWISWDDIHNCLYKAHSVNRKKGFSMTNTGLSGEELKRIVGDGHCFVALFEGRVVGVACLKIFNPKRWWTNNLVAYTFLDAIIPEYRGTDVFLGLENIRNQYIKDSGVRIRQCNTAEKNKTVIKLCTRGGYKMVQYSATGKGAEYYSIIMVLWEDGCPYSDWFCKIMFNMSKYIVKAIWKPGYKLRFWFK